MKCPVYIESSSIAGFSRERSRSAGLNRVQQTSYVGKNRIVKTDDNGIPSCEMHFCT